MNLHNFTNLVRTNIKIFRDDYLDKRSKHPHPDQAYPLTMSQEQWFAQLDIWFRMLEVTMNKAGNQPLYMEKETDDGGVEFTLEDLDDD